MNSFPRFAPALVAALFCSAPLSGCAHARSNDHEADVMRVRLAVASDRVQHRDWPAALDALEPLPAEEEARAAALALRGTVLREKGLLEEAEADLRDSLALRPDRAATHAAIAVLYDLRHELERGATHHARAVEIEPENPSYLNDLAFSLFVRGKPREAIPLYQRALRAVPEDRRIRNNLGFALARAGEFARARQQFALGGTPAEARNNMGYAYEQAGNLPQAYDQYVEAVRLDPAFKRARANLQYVAAALQRKLPEDLIKPGGES